MDFSYVTNGNADPQGKQPVFFTCHPEDFDQYFEKVCRDVISLVDCAIYYTADGAAPLTSPEDEASLGSMRLMVVPVTAALLTQNSRALDHDLVFAAERNIPILPLMMEDGLDGLYSQLGIFRERQYLSPYQVDSSAISYQEKLQQFLAAVLVDEQQMERIRQAFDAYVFLSYRKKDRVYANKLIELIHQNPEFQSVAIWFDEFLTPGESFTENIQAVLSKSDLVLLQVTPNILETVGGVPNFVIREEYPAARALGKPILPVVMAETDSAALQAVFEGLPTPVRGESEALQARLLELLPTLVAQPVRSPERIFLLGLAYRAGIDVERNVELGLALMEEAARAGYHPAMHQLGGVYFWGAGVPRDRNRAIYWARLNADRCAELYGPHDFETLGARNNLAYMYDEIGDYGQALALFEEVYEGECQHYGAEDSRTLLTLHNLASCHYHLNHYEQALELHRRCYELRVSTLGPRHPNTLLSLGSIALLSIDIDGPEAAKQINEAYVREAIAFYGEAHVNTWGAVNNLGYIYDKLGDYQRALECYAWVYERIQQTGTKETLPKAVIMLDNMAQTYKRLGNPQKASALMMEAFELASRNLGLLHADTLAVLDNYTELLCEQDRAMDAMLFLLSLAADCTKAGGAADPGALTFLYKAALFAEGLGSGSDALALYQRIYDGWHGVLGDDSRLIQDVRARKRALEQRGVPKNAGLFRYERPNAG